MKKYKYEIEIKNLDIYYSNKKAVENVNLSIKKNEVVAFIGPSGCGKSTILRTINRMNDFIDTFKATGDILYEGESIFSPDMNTYELRTNIGMVFQKPNPFEMSIYENVIYGLRLQGEKDKDKLDEIVEKSLRGVYLWDEVSDDLDQMGTSLSGGQQQRLCIARAIATNPDVILMDEPTSALDPISTVKVEELIRELKKEYTIIIVTHNMQQAARISDTTCFFYKGSLIEVAKTRELFTNPKEKLTDDYINGRFG